MPSIKHSSDTAKASSPSKDLSTKGLNDRYQILRFFEYSHLPDDLQLISREYHSMAYGLAGSLPWCAETTVALRKLLESKDAAVRAAILNRTS